MKQHNTFFTVFARIIALAILLHAPVHAQTYPVQTHVVTSGPYFNYLSYYGDQNNHLQVIVTLLDFNQPPVMARLRIRIEGPGYELYTNPNAVVGQPFLLEGGVPVNLSGIDLLPYLQQNNLIVSPQGLDINALPEGFTTICVDVIKDGTNQEVLSTNNCTAFSLFKFQPPQTFLPQCASELDTTQMYYTFQWSPPIGYTPDLNSELLYTFSLYRWNDPSNYSIFTTDQGLVWRETDLTMAQVQVSDLDVAFELGGLYVWRVEAQITSNGMPVNMILNNGFSENCTFTFGQAQTLAEALSDGLYIDLFAEPSAENKGKAYWTVIDNTPNVGLSTFDEFFVEYRKQPTGNEGFEMQWFSETVSDFDLFIYQLEPSTTYEVKVSGVVGGVVGDPTPVKTFTTPAARVYACGESDLPFLPSTFTPLENALAGIQVQIGQFKMDISELTQTGSIGHYEGKGTIPIAFLAGAKAKVTFEDILIDTEYRVREGRVDVITQGLENWLLEQYEQFIDPIYVNGTVDSAYVDSNGVAWVVVDGIPVDYPFNPPTYPIIINDASGYQYTIYPNGTVVISIYLEVSEYWTVSPSEVVHFGQNETEIRGFDGKEFMQWHEQYEVMQLSDSSFYFVANKSMAANEGDVVNVQLPPMNNGVSFQFADGSPVTSSSLNGTWLGVAPHGDEGKMTLSIPARSAGEYQIHAYANNQKVGQLNVFVYGKKEKELVVVPLVSNFNYTDAQIEAELDATLGEANIDVDVTVAPQWNDTTFTASTTISLPSDVGLMNKYSEEMIALRDHYFYLNDQMPKDAFYIFVVDGFDDQSELGYMPRGAAYGFVKKTQQDLLRTISHELGHGICALDHSWKDNGPSEGATTNLLDYPLPNATEKRNLTKAQWKEMRDFDFLPNIWDEVEDASSAELVFAEFSISSGNDAVEYSYSTSLIPPNQLFSAGENTFFRFTPEALTKISDLLFENGVLKGVKVFGENNSFHKAYLTRTAAHLSSQPSVGSQFKNLLYTSETNYIFLCNDPSHEKERVLDTVVDGTAYSAVIMEYCDHDFRLGTELEVVECLDVSSPVWSGIHPIDHIPIYEQIDCPTPVNSNLFFIPQTWRNKKDNSVCFMTPDGKTIKMKASSFRGLDFSLGLNELDQPMMPAGCLVEFSLASLSGAITTYKADIVGGVFTGYIGNNGAGYFNDFMQPHPADTGIMLMPAVDGLGVYIYAASQYTYFNVASDGDLVLDLATDKNAVKGWGISRIGNILYSSDDVSNGIIDPSFASQIFPSSSSYIPNTQHRLIVKIVELASAYPDLYARMSKCPFLQWTGVGCLTTDYFTGLNLGDVNNVLFAALTEETQWGYFDYWYDLLDYGSTKTQTEQLELFLLHFRQVVEFNKIAHQTTIAQFLNPANCSEIYESTNWPIVQLQPDPIISAVSAMSIDEIESICLQTRVNLIASLLFNTTFVTNDYEKSIYRLIKHTPNLDKYDLVEKLCTQEYNNEVLIKQLAEKVDDQVMFVGDGNYFSEILKTLIFYYGRQLNAITAMDANSLTNAQILDFKNRIVTYNYTGFVKRLFTSCFTPPLASNGSTISEAVIANFGGTWTITFKDNLQICFTNYQSSNMRWFGLLEPLIVTDEARLMEIISPNGQATTMPAFALYFLEEKAWAKTAVEAVETAIDAVTLVIPGAQASFFFRVVNYADKLSSLTNMGANFSEIDNPTLSSFLSLTSGILGLADITATGVTKFKTVSSGGGTADDVLSLVTRNADQLSQSHEKAIQDLLDVIDNHTDAELLDVLGSQKAKASLIKLLEAEDDYLRQLNRPNLADDVKLRVNALKGVANGANAFMDNIYTAQKAIVNQWKNVIATASNMRKGNFGEMGSDVFLTEKGYQALHTRMQNIDETTHQGIDGVFLKDGEYFIVESKYHGTATLSTLANGTKQMSDDWIIGDNRLLNAVGPSVLQDINAVGYRRLLAEIAPDGTVIYKELDASASVIGIFNP